MVVERQSLVVDADEVENRGVQVVDVVLVLHAEVDEIVGLAVSHAPLRVAAVCLRIIRKPDWTIPDAIGSLSASYQ